MSRTVLRSRLFVNSIIVGLLAGALSAPPASASKELDSTEAPYFDAYGDNYCWTYDRCNVTASYEEGTITMNGSSDSPGDDVYTEAWIHAHVELPADVHAVVVTATVDLTASTQASADAESYAFSDIGAMLGAYTGPCGCSGSDVVVEQVAASLAGECEDCEVTAPASTEGVREFSVILANDDGTDVPAGTVHVDFAVFGNIDSFQPTPPPPPGPGVTYEVRASPARAYIGTSPSDPSNTTYSVDVRDGRAPPVSITNEEEPEPVEPAPPPTGRLDLAARLIKVSIYEVKERGPGDHGRDPPGKTPKEPEGNRTYLAEGPYDLTSAYNWCPSEPRCQPTAFSQDGHAQVRVQTGDAMPPSSLGSSYRANRLSFAHTVDVPLASEAMNVTLLFNITSALAETAHMVSEGAAYIRMQVSAEHLDCVDMWCHGSTTVMIAEAGTGFCCLDEDGPPSRANELLEIPISVTNFYRDVMPPGRVKVTFDVLAGVNVGTADRLLESLGPHSTAALDAHVDGIRVDIDPAAWPV